MESISIIVSVLQNLSDQERLLSSSSEDSQEILNLTERLQWMSGVLRDSKGSWSLSCVQTNSSGETSSSVKDFSSLGEDSVESKVLEVLWISVVKVSSVDN